MWCTLQLINMFTICEIKIIYCYVEKKYLFNKLFDKQLEYTNIITLNKQNFLSKKLHER